MRGQGLLELSPLSTTVAAASTIYPDYRTVRLGLPVDEPGWVRCADVIGDAEFMRRWQADVGSSLGTEHEVVPTDHIGDLRTELVRRNPGVRGCGFLSARPAGAAVGARGDGVPPASAGALA